MNAEVFPDGYLDFREMLAVDNELPCTNRWDFKNDAVTADTTLHAKWSAADSLAFTSVGGPAYEASKGSGTLGTNLYVPAYYKAVPVTSIGTHAFEYCDGLTTVVVPDSITNIAEYAFYGCSQLQSISIPAATTNIGYDAFWFCYLLSGITVDPQNAGYTSIDGVLFNKSASRLICYPIGKTGTSYDIPSSVTTVDMFALNSTNLYSITIPTGVTSIEYCAFQNCQSLTGIFVPIGVTDVATYTFIGCYRLTIRCEAASQPSGWASDWNLSDCPVAWGCSS